MPGTPATTPRHAIPRIATTDTDDVPRDLNAAVDRIDVTAPVFISGLASARPAAGIADRYHFATDTGELSRDSGTAWTTVNPRSVPTVTSLPGAPYDGQIIDYLADATNGIVWRFRYRAASASAFKWEALGAPIPLIAEVLTAETTASTTYADLATVGPQVTVPLAGDYDIDFGFTSSNSSAGSTGMAAPKLGAAATSDNDRALTNNATAGQASSSSPGSPLRRTGLAAAATVKLQYRVSAGTGTFQYRRISARPVRVG